MNRHAGVHAIIHAGLVVDIHAHLPAVGHAHLFVLVLARRQVQIAIRLNLLLSDHVMLALALDGDRLVVLDVGGAVVPTVRVSSFSTSVVRSFSAWMRISSLPFLSSKRISL